MNTMALAETFPVCRNSTVEAVNWHISGLTDAARKEV